MSNNKGFTLIEMMIVLAIIGIIITMTYPSLSKAYDMSNENDLNQQQKVVNKALIEYYALTGTYPNQGGNLASDLATQTGVILNTGKYQYTYISDGTNFPTIDVEWIIRDTLW